MRQIWHGTTENLNEMLSDIANKCECEVMVAETQYPFTSANGDDYANALSEKIGDMKRL